MFRSVIFVSACLVCAAAQANEPLKNPANDVKASGSSKINPSANGAVSLEANAGVPKLPLARARIFSFYAQTDEAPELAS